MKNLTGEVGRLAKKLYHTKGFNNNLLRGLFNNWVITLSQSWRQWCQA